MRSFYFIPLILISITCCTPKPTVQENKMTEKEINEAMIEQNRKWLKQEREAIQLYLDSSLSEFKQTGSGLYYSEIVSHHELPRAVESDLVEFEYEVKTIQGELLDSSEKNGNKKMRLLRDNEILGLHEGIALMGEGEDYIFIIPAHLAYGLGGEDLIPMQATLIYQVKIVSINK